MKEQIWQRWAEHRPGMQLAAVIPTAINVVPYIVDCLLHIKDQYPLANEFVIKSVRAGLCDLKSISNFLGVGDEIVAEVVSEELRSGTLRQLKSGKLGITPAGQSRLENLELNKNVREDRTVYKDLVSGELVNYEKLSPTTKNLHPGEEGDPKTGEFLSLPIVDSKKKASFSVQKINDVVGTDTTSVIQIKGIPKSRTAQFKAAWLLVFSDFSLQDVAFDVLIDGEIAVGHSLAIAPQDLVKAFEIKLGTPVGPPGLAVALAGVAESNPQALAEIVEAVRDADAFPVEGQYSIDLGLPPKIGPGMFQAQDEAPSRVSVFEHSEILKNSLQFASVRLMIFSPWIKGGVVNKAFIADLKKALKRGVEVTFVYGLGEADDNTQWSLDRLCEVAKEHRNFHFLRHNNTHAKAFIVDDSVVITSFNWLSFMGDEARTYRMEEGMKYSGKAVVDPWYTVYQTELANQATFACT